MSTEHEVSRLMELAELETPLVFRAVLACNLAEQFKDDKASVPELAAASGIDPDALARILRCLAAKGVVEEYQPGQFVLARGYRTVFGQSSTPAAFPFAPSELRAWARADDCLRYGKSAFPSVHGESYWDYLRTHPRESRAVDECVESSNHWLAPLLRRLYPWEKIGLLVDVGGGNGSFLAELLRQIPGMRGVLFDQPHVVAAADRIFSSFEVQDRCRVTAGSFFEEIPTGGDAYLLKTILHDWSDHEAQTILRQIRRSMTPGAQLLVIEALIGDGNRFDIGKLLDLNSFILADGLDRREDQLLALISTAGYRITQVFRTTHALTLIEAVPGSEYQPCT